MRNVNSIAGCLERQFRKLSAEVKGLAGQTAQSPKVLAQGLYQLVSSGFKAGESVKILRAAAIAASAGLTDTETSVTALAGVLNAYHLPASKATEVSDSCSRRSTGASSPSRSSPTRSVTSCRSPR
jgi:TP901 family phage tail tape measure protein